ncbi:MAG: hypothetical protein M3Q39_16305 [Actinomycetota bacterium]|nr:hypothetical protein [Actinomycetota bacterium]
MPPDDEVRVRHLVEAAGEAVISAASRSRGDLAIEPQIARVREVFEASGKASYVPHEQAVENPMFKIHLDTFSGEPTAEEIPLHDWRGSGSIWMTLNDADDRLGRP